jgi:hypothetical protein
MLENRTLTAALILTLCACGGSASITRKDHIGGSVQLAGAYMPAMSDARLLMAEHCNGRFQASELDHVLEFRCRASAARADTRPLAKLLP